MHERIRVNLGERSYDIVAGAGLLAEAGQLVRETINPSRAAVVCDDRVATLYADGMLASLRAAGVTADVVAFPAGEESKSLAQYGKVLDSLFALGLDRRSCVVALGGGVTGDLAGFAAASYMRGVALVQAPTTLLAQVDSSSGGKTGVNHPAGKNMVGAFHQPALVLIDTDTLRTLPRAELLCGLAEAVKHGAIRDAEYFRFIAENSAAILALEPTALRRLILGSCAVKAAIVSADERERGERALLNFGHTFGHAYEKLSNFALRHGEAVAMGMLAACALAEETRGLTPEVREELRRTLAGLGLPETSPAFPAAAALEAMKSDKKTERGVFRFVLPDRLGAAAVREITDAEAVLRALRATGCV